MMALGPTTVDVTQHGILRSLLGPENVSADSTIWPALGGFSGPGLEAVQKCFRGTMQRARR